jgi:hypothetical protein
VGCLHRPGSAGNRKTKGLRSQAFLEWAVLSSHQ